MHDPQTVTFQTNLHVKSDEIDILFQNTLHTTNTKIMFREQNYEFRNCNFFLLSVHPVKLMTEILLKGYAATLKQAF